MATVKHLEHKIENKILLYSLDEFDSFGLLKIGDDSVNKDFVEELLQKHKLKGIIVKSFENVIKLTVGEEVPEEIIITENDLQFIANLNKENIGFNLDQKLCREIVKDHAINKNVLSLFGDTGVYSTYAAKAGSTTTTVTKDPRTRKNFELNNLDLTKNEIWENDPFEFLNFAEQTDTKFNLIILDIRQELIKDVDFDFKSDHVKLIRRLQQNFLTMPGMIFFITDIQGFVLDSYIRPGADKLTKKTLMPEYDDLKAHQSFVFYN